MIKNLELPEKISSSGSALASAQSASQIPPPRFVAAADPPGHGRWAQVSKYRRHLMPIHIQSRHQIVQPPAGTT